MKPLLVITFLFVTYSTKGQNTKYFVGSYSFHHFMHTYQLTLKDSGKFVVNESSDVFTRKASGTWILSNREITLTPVETGKNDSVPGFKPTKINVGKRNELYLTSEMDRKAMRLMRKHGDPKEYFRLKKDSIK